MSLQLAHHVRDSHLAVKNASLNHCPNCNMWLHQKREIKLYQVIHHQGLWPSAFWDTTFLNWAMGLIYQQHLATEATNGLYTCATDCSATGGPRKCQVPWRRIPPNSSILGKIVLPRLPRPIGNGSKIAKFTKSKMFIQDVSFVAPKLKFPGHRFFSQQLFRFRSHTDPTF